MKIQTRIALGLLTAAIGGAEPCRAADEPQGPMRTEHARSIEIGGGVGIVGSWWTGPFSGGDVRVSVPAGRRGDVETIVALTPASDGETLGLYGVQYRQRLRPGRLQPFLTFGGFGIFYHERGESMVTAPILGLVGAGIEHRLARRLAVRAEVQGIVALVIPVGVRVAAGLSVPLGR
jgi:hypothetical protein